MSQIWQPQDMTVYIHWIETITIEASDDLTDWESKFVQSLSDRLNGGRNLTEAQAQTLEAIYSAKTK